MNTPSISVSNNRKAIMYSLTRRSTPQDAQITSGIMNVVSMTNSTEIPSTPSLYFSPSNQSRSSTNWKSVFCGSNPASTKSDTRKVITVATRATHLALRCAAASSPRRKMARIAAASAGMKVTRESRLSFIIALLR